MKNKIKGLFTHPAGVLCTAVLCTLLWGSAFPSIKLGYEWFQIGAEDLFSKILFAGLRFFLAGAVVFVFGWAVKGKPVLPSRQSVFGISLLGLVQTALQYLFFYIGLSYTTGVKGSIINSSGAFLAVILAHFCYRDDRLNWKKWMGCIFGLLGIILVNLDGGELGGSFRLMGEGFMFFAAVCFAAGALISKRIAKKADSVTITAWQLMLGGFVLCAVGTIGGGSFSIPDWKGGLLFAHLVLLSSVAFVLWTELLKYNPMGKVSVYNFLIPVFGTLLSVLLLRETALQPATIGALGLVCIGIFIVNFQGSSRKSAGKEPSLEGNKDADRTADV